MDPNISQNLTTQELPPKIGINWPRIALIFFVALLSGAFFGVIGYQLGVNHVTKNSSPHTTVVNVPRQASTPTPPPVISIKPTAPISESISPSPSEQETIKNWVMQFYTSWINQIHGKRDTEDFVSQGYITSKAADSINAANDYDLPTCSQNPLNPNAYSYSTPVIQGDQASMTLTGGYDGPPPSTIIITLNLVKVGSKWSIDSFQCPK